MKFVKPKKLEKGDSVAIVSPSKGLPSIFPHIYENGLKVLKEKFGLKIVEFPTARKDVKELYLNPKMRADDINRAFADKKIKAIIASIGGDDSVRILKYLDKKIIASNPKIFMGYSDTTTINTFINQLGIISFNGPSIMGGFSQMENYPDAEKHVKDFLFTPSEEYKYLPYKEWSMAYLDWAKKENVGKITEKFKNSGWNWIQGEKIVEGKLFGGCVEVLEMMKGTSFWPSNDFLKGKILFLETSEDKPSPDFVKYALRNYGIMGVFDNIVAIIFGRPRDYNEEEKKALEKNLIDVVATEFGHPEIPIITNFDFGHTDPQVIMPLGANVKIDCKKKTVVLTEKVVSD